MIAPPNGNGNGNGRPKGTTKLETEPKLYRELIERLRVMPSTTAAALSGISFQTLLNYLERGENEFAQGTLFADFFDEAIRAKAEFKASIEAMALVQDPKWMLANLYPEEYSNRARLEVSGQIDHGNAFDVMKDPELRDAVDKAYARRCALPPLADPGGARN